MNVFLPYNRDTILTNARKINGIALTLGTIAAASFLGSLTYQIVGWPHGRLASLIILVAAFFIAERVTHVLKPQKLAPLNGPFIFLNTCLAIGYLVLGFYLVSHATPVWIGSVFQAVPRRILALFGFLSIAVVLLHSRKLLASINQFLFWLFIFGFTALVFRTGFGFDIFVHDATVRAWQSAGFIAPRSFLYGGFYSIVAALSTLSGARPLFIINWITPIVGALVFLYASLQRKSIIFSLLF